MPKRIVFGIMLMQLLIGMWALIFSIQVVEASGTIYIRAGGSVSPDTAPISTVDNITYTLMGNINDSIVVERDNIVVDGAEYTVQGTGSGSGIELAGRTNVTIRNTEIRKFKSGILLDNSSNNTIAGNNITDNSCGVMLGPKGSIDNNNVSENQIANNGYGIWLRYYCNFNNIRRNKVTNNYKGITLWTSSNNNITGNILSGNHYGFEVLGSELQDFVNFVDSTNLVNGKPVYYLLNAHDITIEPSTFSSIGYLALVNSTNITVNNLNLTNNMQGILLAFTANSTIDKNNITNNYGGIWLVGSSGNKISGNNIANNDNGIGCTGASDNTMSGNNITANDDNGISLAGSSNNNAISGNNITANGWAGINFDHCSDNTIFRNTMQNNRYCIWMEHASNNNLFYHNNFVNNTRQAENAYSNCTWDNGYPSGGNYWSDYNGTDLDDDGIGDTPYIIDEYNQDNYPLMSAWRPPPSSPLSPSLWMEWWFWLIVAAGIAVLAGAVYFLKKRKPPTPTVPPEGPVSNVTKTTRQ